VFANIFSGISEFFSNALPGFSVGCFLKGVVEGLAFGLGALLVIAALPAELAVLVAVGLIALGIVGLVSLANAWPSMNGDQRSETVGGILGGLIAGKAGPGFIPPPAMPAFALAQTTDGTIVLMPATMSPIASAAVSGAGAGAAGAGAAGTMAMTGGGGSGSSGSGPDQKRFEDLAREDGKITPKGEREAKGILDAEKEGKIDPGSARRPAEGEPKLDYYATKDGKGAYYDVKSPSSSYPRPLADQAADIGEKSNLYDKDTNLIVDLRDVDASQKAAFKQDLVNSGADMSKIQFVNE
jgi:hypothetical protein